jgi:uncharacterized surface protein with fasciclin (FAS1) repeats
MNENKGMWIWIVGIIVVVALGIWWLAASQNVDISGGFFSQFLGSSAPSSTTNQTTTTSGQQQQVSGDVVAVAEHLSGASTFATWLSSTGVGAQVTGKGPYTIFVPTDGAISQLPAGTFSNLSAAQKKRFVQYHVVVGREIDASAQTAGTIQALSGDALNFSYGTNKIPMVDNAIIITQYKASNGVVYLVDNVLIPPKKAQ